MKESYTIGVLFGGASAEHDVSIITGQYIISVLEKLGHKVVPIYIDHASAMHSDPALGKLSYFKENKATDKFSGWSIASKDSKCILSRKKGLSTTTHVIDMLFPALHGTNGEDGAFQGLAQILSVPYAGSSMEASVIAMNKTLTKRTLESHGIKTPPYIACSKEDWVKNQETIVSRIEGELAYPLFTKPPHAGSSIGISKAKNRDELINGIELALHYDTECLVEEGVSGARDITVALLGNDELQVSFTQESHSSEMLSYEDKYINDGGAQFGGSDEVMTIPAELSDNTEKEIRDLAIKVYKILGMQGTGRVDFLVSDTDDISVIEVNPLPGTLYNHLWEKTGVSGEELISKMIELGFESCKKRTDSSHEFNSSILQHANSMKLKVD